MKIKKFNKKLGLNKITVVNLNDSDMNNVFGGVATDGCVPSVDVSNCATNCLCGTMADTCPTVDGVSCPVTRRCW